VLEDIPGETMNQMTRQLIDPLHLPNVTASDNRLLGFALRTTISLLGWGSLGDIHPLSSGIPEARDLD
jgi:hypothetical protein